MRTVVMETTAGPITFRYPCWDDLLAFFGSLPVLHEKGDEEGDGPAPTRSVEDLIKARKDDIRLTDALLIECSLSPVLTEQKCLPVEGGPLFIKILSTQERTRIGSELLDLSGLSKKEAERIAPLVETAEPSLISMQLDGATP